MARRFATRSTRKLFVTMDQRIGRGVVIDPEIRTKPTRSSPNGRPGARLRCDCGTVYEAPMIALVSFGGKQVNTPSCGCLKRERAAAIGKQTSTTHGMREHELYGTWRQMLQRCENPDHESYRQYGAKGRTVCERWHDIRIFVEDIERDLGLRPDGMTLDRIDNDGNYEPGNVRWATNHEQSANRHDKFRGGKLDESTAGACRRRRQDGETLSALAREFGVSPRTMSRAVNGQSGQLPPICD